MQINYKNNSLKNSLTIPKVLAKTYGQRAQKIKQRIEDFKAAKNLAVIGKIPGAGCHQLKGNRKEELAVWISGNWRICFIADHNPLPLKEDGGLNWDDVTTIKIIKVEDYHKK